MFVFILYCQTIGHHQWCRIETVTVLGPVRKILNSSVYYRDVALTLCERRNLHSYHFTFPPDFLQPNLADFDIVDLVQTNWPKCLQNTFPEYEYTCTAQKQLCCFQPVLCILLFYIFFEYYSFNFFLKLDVLPVNVCNWATSFNSTCSQLNWQTLG